MLGIDIVSIPRIEAATKRHGQRFLQRFLCESELALAKNAKSTAGLWAAKEAVSKALGCGICEKLGFYDIKIIKEASGKPTVYLSERSRHLANGRSIAVSITHDGDYAVAVSFLFS